MKYASVKFVVTYVLPESIFTLDEFTSQSDAISCKLGRLALDVKSGFIRGHVARI
jgi:hypothetical protein